jgi:predicted DNA-binding transcriptional regulator AlpA
MDTKPYPDDEVLWTLNDVAKFMAMSWENARKHVVTKEGFPAPVNFGRPKWYPSEVKAWVAKHR